MVTTTIDIVNGLALDAERINSMKKPQEEKEIRVIKMDLFPWDILYTVGTNEKEIFDYLKDKCFYELDSEEREFLKIDGTTKLGRCVKFKNKAILLWVKHKDPTTLAHEAFHAITFILEAAGVQFSDKSDEVWAYGLEYIMRKAMTK